VARDWDLRGDELAAEAIAEGRPTAWFDRLYAEGVAGTTEMPWDRDGPHPLLLAWTQEHGVTGEGRRAVVVGCGLGADAEHVAGLGFATTAFDIAPTAIATARARHPGSPVDYLVADLLDLPDELVSAFDLVVEVFTLQALPDPPRTAAAAGVRRLVRPGGTLLAVLYRADAEDPARSGPPYAFDRAAMEALAGDELDLVRLEPLLGPGGDPRWRAEYRRPAS
jgi:SAM-dependent methyltransferase